MAGDNREALPADGGRGPFPLRGRRRRTGRPYTLGDVLRSVISRRYPPADTGVVDVARVTAVARALGLVAVFFSVCVSEPFPGVRGRGLAVAITLGVSAVAWIVWICAGRRHHLVVGALIVMSGAGGVLAALSPRSGAVVIGCVVAITTGAQLSADVSLGITAETVTAFLFGVLVTGVPVGFVVGYPIGFVGVWTVGLTRRAHILRAEQAEQTLDQTRRAHAAEAEAAALAERARIAREIHDVLAHSLAAVSVNLQAAEGLLGELPAGGPELAQAIDCVARAATLTKEGMADARRAILALRHDAAPLVDQLSSLAEGYRSAGDLTVDFEVTGVPRPVGAEAALAVYRTAQEALTNARKHAPAEPVSLCLGFEADAMTVSVHNPLPLAGVGGPLATAGVGYGLTGLRERAALAGGTLEAGPVDGRWRVCLRIPA